MVMTFGHQRLGLIGAALLFCGSATGARNDLAASLELLRSEDARVARIDYYLRTANVDRCPVETRLAGWALHALGQYSPQSRPIARRVFGLDDFPGVEALVAGAPADRAGIRQDDALVAVNGVSLGEPPDMKARASSLSLERRIAAIQAELDRGRARVTVRRVGASLVFDLTGTSACAARVVLTPSGTLNSWADGDHVGLSTALVEFTRNDDELAFILAHELAHNLLRHKGSDSAAAAAGTPDDRGPGRVRAEIEADRLAVLLMERAGYRSSGVLDFWPRLERKLGSIRGSDHPSITERVGILEAAAAAEHTRSAP
jgi:beta-barrel assembly-enhancing protease